MRIILLFLMLTTTTYAAQNSRDWMYLSQNLVGGSVLSSPSFSAFNSVTPFKYYSVAVTYASSSDAAWKVSLEGSLDNLNWTQLMTSNNDVTGPGKMSVITSAFSSVIFKT
jgi:hypothetical protein